MSDDLRGSRRSSAALFGAAGGPIAFIAGQRLGAVTLLPPVLSHESVTMTARTT